MSFLGQPFIVVLNCFCFLMVTKVVDPAGRI